MNFFNNEIRWLPDYLQSAAGHTLPQYKKQCGGIDYLEKMLSSINRVLAEDMSQEKQANEKFFLRQVDPRIKIIGVLALILTATMTGSLYFLLTLQILFASAAFLSGISLKSYFSRVWAPALLFSGIAVFPAIFSWITPGEVLIDIHQGSNLAVTRQGITGAAFVLLRTTASLGLAFLLIKTTPWPTLTRALSSLGMPGIFVMTLDLTYRYIFLFVMLLSDYILGRRSRLVAVENHYSRLDWIGSSMAGFLRLSIEYSRDITSAMLARGYTGDTKGTLPVRAKKMDWCFAAIIIIICASAWGGGLIANL